MYMNLRNYLESLRSCETLSHAGASMSQIRPSGFRTDQPAFDLTRIGEKAVNENEHESRFETPC